MRRDADEQLAVAWHEILGSYHAISCALDRELNARHGLTVSEFEVLQQLSGTEPEQKMRMHDLADEVHLTQSALSRLIARLETDGLVTRSMCQDDRRAIWAELTPAGAQRYAEARPTQRATLREQRTDRLDRVAAALRQV